MKIFFVVMFLFWSDVLHAQAMRNEPISSLRIKSDPDQGTKPELGYLLFEDKRLSHNDTISCSSCHNLKTNGADNKKHSFGIMGREGSVNTPTIFNSGFNFAQFWDGRAKSLEEQVDGPIHDTKEMGTDWNSVVRKISADPKYIELFETNYKDGITAKNIKDAIASFERQLVTLDSPFDRYLDGDSEALTAQEIQGYIRFKSLGCIACHQGHNVGGNMFQTMGIMGDYFKDRKTPIKKEDLGRYNVTHLEQDKFVFRVPSLRNVALTPPYFHDGSAKTLENAVKIMGQYQLGQKLQKEDISLIVAFLKTLTGREPEFLKKNAK